MIQANASKGKFINIVKSSNLILPEFQEMKCCINRVETVNTAMGL